MKKDRLISYMSEHFFKGQNKYRGNNFDTKVLKRNIGKEVPLSLAEWNEYDNKYYWSQPEFQIPDNEKSFSKKYNKLVPNRWLWEIKPL